ncbi:hypothetical protein N836_32370 [Leptolyngbya sp. Heron Island J]|uniref:hypothetical protein n=1 Tax=Leptolyngbya sp. Heron Island J TaxID=1385935 RepID=UPI0003B969CD|nr:hypothetical protein [Leptolyngbya sp. Heron Island J]ESA38129.1 hypothetical protein N836_32370 [Leptolyngbya sp. Heron Island J]
MFIDNSQGTGVPTDLPTSGALSEYQYEDVRLMLLGSLTSFSPASLPLCSSTPPPLRPIFYNQTSNG